MTDLETLVAANPTAPGWAFEAFKRRHPRELYGIKSREAWAAAIRWMRTMQVNHPWHRMTPTEAVRELRLGEASIYYAFFDVEDAANVKCPLCAQMVWIRAEGVCPDCREPIGEPA